MANSSNVVNPSSLFEVESWLFKRLDLNTESLPSEPKEILLPAFILIDDELENMVISECERLLQKLQTMSMVHQYLTALPIQSQNATDAVNIVFLAHHRVLILLHHARLHVIAIIDLQDDLQ